MPGDPYKKVQRGQPQQFSAEFVNDTIDTVRDFKARGPSQRPGDGASASLPPGQMYIRNSSGGNLDRFSVLGVSDALISPTDNANGFAETAGAAGVTPTADHVGGRFVVLVEPIASGKVGRAFAGAICICKVNVSDADHWFADAEAGESAALVSAATGPVQLLWKESGTGDGKWAIGRFAGKTRPDLIAVTLTSDGGVAGDNATTCTLTYTVKDLAGTTLNTAMTPDRPRYANCQYDTPAADSPGLAYYDDADVLHLYEAVEEKPTGDLVEVVTTYQIDTGTQKFQKKTRDVLVIEAGDESDWIDVHTGDLCA